MGCKQKIIISNNKNLQMQQLLEKISRVQAQFDHGSIMVPKVKYPFMAFLCGFLYSRIKPFEKLFSTLECLQHLQAENKINSIYWEQLLLALYDKPQKLQQISNILEKIIDNEDVQLLLELEKIEQSPESANHATTEQNQPPRKDEYKAEKIEKVESEEFNYEQYLRNIDKMNKESEALAKKLQEEEEKLNKPQQQEEIVCEICYVGLYEEEWVPLESCEHIFHKNCLSQSFKAQISEKKFPLTCPHDSCKAEVRDNDIKQILEKDVYQKYEKNTLKLYADLNGDTISWCPTVDCEYMFFFNKDDENRFQCPECGKQYCLNCRVEWHSSMTCKEYQITHTTSEEDKQFMKFVQGKKFKQCPRCKFWVEKNQGCDHMTCKCKFQFCYKCGGNYGKCECVAKAQEEMRRRQQLAQEQRRKKLERMQKKKAKALAPEPATKPTTRRNRRSR